MREFKNKFAWATSSSLPKMGAMKCFWKVKVVGWTTPNEWRLAYKDMNLAHRQYSSLRFEGGPEETFLTCDGQARENFY